MRAILDKLSNFNGRSGRREVAIIVGMGAFLMALGNYLDTVSGPREIITARMGKIELLTFVIALLPTTSVCVRRLHDTGRSGLWLLLFYVPYVMWLSTENNPKGELFANGGVLIGAIALFIFMVLPGEADANRFGQKPDSIF
jgi:uncharacterized membrane protein YhaH (DUF805 family)